MSVKMTNHFNFYRNWVDLWNCMCTAGSDVSQSATTSASSNTASEEQSTSDGTGTSAASATGIATVVGILPGLGDYTDSDRSDTSSSDSEIDMDMFRREAQVKHGHDAAAGSATVKHRHHWVNVSYEMCSRELWELNCGTAVQSVKLFKVFIVCYTVDCQWFWNEAASANSHFWTSQLGAVKNLVIHRGGDSSLELGQQSRWSGVRESQWGQEAKPR